VTFIGGGFSSSETLRLLFERLVDSQTLSSAKQKIKTYVLDPYFKPNAEIIGGLPFGELLNPAFY
jgi:hypothetical protein